MGAVRCVGSQVKDVTNLSPSVNFSVGAARLALASETDRSLELFMSRRKNPLMCAKCLKEIPHGEAHMRAPDLRAYHLACYESRRRRKPRR